MPKKADFSGVTWSSGKITPMRGVVYNSITGEKVAKLYDSAEGHQNLKITWGPSVVIEATDDGFKIRNAKETD